MSEQRMTELERWLAVIDGERPDHWPILLLHALGSVHAGGMEKLHAEGLPEWVCDIPTWQKYWGADGYVEAHSLAADLPEIATESWVEGEFRFIRRETGSLTREVVDNARTYSMPDFIEFDVTDRPSWERFREKITPRAKADVEAQAAVLDGRDRPARIDACSSWGRVRVWMGPERALLGIYDQPDLIREMIEWQTWYVEEFVFPVIERYRVEVVHTWEDFCYNHGMLISPAAFRDLCAPHYRRVAEVCRHCGVKLRDVDTDGYVAEVLPLLEEVGFNGIWPMEQVCGNDLLAYRRKHPDIVFLGGIEKNVANTGNAALIRPELLPKVPEMIEGGRYFPSFDHALQPLVGFEELCCVMTLLHEICGSEGRGEYPRRRPEELVAAG